MNGELTEKDFTEKVIDCHGLAIVQFKTEWNGGCQIIRALYEELSRCYAASASFYTIDTDEEKRIADTYRITELPTILFFKNGALIDHVTGLTPKHVLIEKIEGAIIATTN
jgi:thioredoxin 1